jgi:hypothetical protein
MVEMELTDTVAHAPGIVSRLVDGEAVLVDARQGMVRVLNSTGARIWELIDGRRTVAELAGCIASEYAIDAARARADTLAFCNELVRRNALFVGR